MKRSVEVSFVSYSTTNWHQSLETDGRCACSFLPMLFLITKCNSNERLRARRRNFAPSFEMDIQPYMAFSTQTRQTTLPSTVHLPALNALVRATSRTAPWSKKLSSAIIQTTSRTIKKVRKSTLKILNMKTKKATSNIQSTRIRRRPTHNTTKHNASKVPPGSTAHQLRSLSGLIT